MAFRLPTFALFLGLSVACLSITACVEGGEPSSTGSGPEAASAASGEAAPSDGRTHWINDESIGHGMAPVSAAMLEAGLEDPTSWLIYGGNYANYRHSPIERLTPAAVPNLRMAWSFPTGTDLQFEVSPIVYDGIMYVSSSYNRLFALDAATGEIYWRYDHQQPDDLL